MLDDDDGEGFWLMALFTDGPWSLIFLGIAIVIWVIAAGNKTDCAKKSCPDPQQKPALIKNQCLCVTEAK